MHHSRPFIGKKLSSCSLEVIYWIQNYVQVSEKLALGAKTAVDIEKLRDGYRPAAKRGAILFFVLAEMSTVNSMYQYSLASYLDVFRYSLRKSLPDSILKKRLKNIQDTLTYNVYSYGCTGKELQSPYVWWASVNVPMFETRYNVAIVSFSTLFALYKAIFFFIENDSLKLYSCNWGECFELMLLLNDANGDPMKSQSLKYLMFG